MNELFSHMPENSQEGIVTKDMLITLYKIHGKEAQGFREMIALHAAHLEAISMEDTKNPGFARLECALKLAELYVEIGFVAEAYETALELSDVAEKEVNGIELIPRINALLQMKPQD